MQVQASKSPLKIERDALNNTRRILYLLGFGSIAVGAVSVASDHSNTFNVAASLLAVCSGILLLITTRFALSWARYLSCAVPILLASISIAQAPGSAASFGYTVAVTMAGVLISGQAILFVGGVALLAYLLAYSASPGAWQSLDQPIMVLVANLLLVALLYSFANTQRRTAAEAVANAIEAKRALTEQQAGAVREETAKVEVSDLAKDLLTGSDQQQGAATSSSSAASEISSQVVELATNARQVADSARLVQVSSEEATVEANMAGQSLAADREQLNRAVVAGEQMQTAARQVETSVAKVTQVLGLISEIAADTHLLSLNATIEAAGAGTAGKRFAVVAGEVGKLANKVNGAVEEIGTLVAGMQGTVQVMRHDADQALTSVRQSQAASVATGEQIAQLLLQLDKVMHETYQISSATAQQQGTTSQIANSMQDLTKISSQTAALSGQLATIASRLNEAAGRLVGKLAQQLEQPSS